MKDNERVGYTSSLALDRAIKEASRVAASNSGKSIDEHITFALFDRFLCRLFSAESPTSWVLKGGTGLLARSQNARTTKDIDLYASQQSQEVALNQLVQASSIDLGDHLIFDYRGHETILVGDQAPHLTGLRVSFDVRIGVRAVRGLKIDLALGLEDVEDFDRIEPQMRLALPKLVTFPYNVYSVVRQVADKYCAAITIYAHGVSSRARDLFDIVFLARTNTFAMTDLQSALGAELAKRGLQAPTRYVAPIEWRSIYQALLTKNNSLLDFPTFSDAEDILNELMIPKSETPMNFRWDPKLLKWTTQDISDG
jgi:hypothetical protein